MTDADTKVLDKFGNAIHVGDAVFAIVPYRFFRVESFSYVNDRGTTVTFVNLDGWQEPSLLSSLEVIADEGDLDDKRWDDRRTYCGFHPHAEWEAFGQKRGRQAGE